VRLAAVDVVVVKVVVLLPAHQRFRLLRAQRARQELGLPCRPLRLLPVKWLVAHRHRLALLRAAPLLLFSPPFKLRDAAGVLVVAVPCSANLGNCSARKVLLAF
jgi:hypothetical protein